MTDSNTTPETPSSYVIRHSHGQEERYDSLEDVWSALRSVYGEEIYAGGPDGWEATDAETWPGHGDVLVWSDEESSVDDPGQRAVASISARYSA